LIAARSAKPILCRLRPFQSTQPSNGLMETWGCFVSAQLIQH
jgi:hypothetical protein